MACGGLWAKKKLALTGNHVLEKEKAGKQIYETADTQGTQKEALSFAQLHSEGCLGIQVGNAVMQQIALSSLPRTAAPTGQGKNQP